MELYGITNSGKVRQQNQDVFKTFISEDESLAVIVVCDGMGGARAGNVASELAAETFMSFIEQNICDSITIEQAAVLMSEAVLEANSAVFEKSSAGAEFAGMGTTLTALISAPYGEVVANVGDSRAYHVTQNSISQITKDHSIIEDLVARGDITRAEARKHPNKHLITRALGTNYTEEPDLFFPYLPGGDYIVLCSDGLTNLLMDNEILFEMQRDYSINEICENLIETALNRGAPDNVTAVIFKK